MSAGHSRMAFTPQPRRTMSKNAAAVDTQLVILTALVLTTILFIGAGMWYSTHLIQMDDMAKAANEAKAEEMYMSKLHKFHSQAWNQSVVEEHDRQMDLNAVDRKVNAWHHRYNAQMATVHHLQENEIRHQNAMEVDDSVIVRYDDDGKSPLFHTAMKWGNWALCAKTVQFNRRDTFEYMQELARDFQGRVKIAKDGNSFTVDWSHSIGSKPCHDPRYVSQDILFDVNMMFNAQCSCNGEGLASDYSRNQTWTRMLPHNALVFREDGGVNVDKKYRSFKDCGVRIWTGQVRENELKLTSNIESWDLDARHLKYAVKPQSQEHFDDALGFERAQHLRRSRCPKRSTYSLDPKRLKTKGISDVWKRAMKPVSFHEDDRLVMELETKVFDDEEDHTKVKDVFFHYVFQKDYYFFSNAGLLTFANIAIKHMIRMRDENKITRDIPILEMGAADGWFGTACMAVMPEADLTFTDIHMKFMDDLKWGWKRNGFDEKRVTYLEGSLFDPLYNNLNSKGRVKKYDYMYFNPPQERKLEYFFHRDSEEHYRNSADVVNSVFKNIQDKIVRTEDSVTWSMMEDFWAAPQLNIEPMEEELVKGYSNIKLFTEFEAVYEQFLFPGGVVFFVVDSINVPVLYKMFLISPRAKHRVMRRWWVPNSDQAFIAVSDERKYSNDNAN